MKTVFSSHAQCAHVWAQQTQSEGRSGPLYFYGPAIYSYGQHYCIARFTDAVTVTGARIVLFNSVGSSKTTQGKHKPVVSDALSGLNVRLICVPDAARDHARNMRYFAERYADHVLKAARAKKCGEFHIGEAEAMRDTAAVYADAFGLEHIALPAISPELMAKAKADAQKARAADAAKRKAREAEWKVALLDRCRRWRAGESVSVPYNAGDTMLRLSGDGETVQTSRGASVPLADAEKLWEIISRCAARGLEYRQPVSVGHFTLRSIAADGTCIVGCHTLTFAETRAFAKAQGWPV